MMQSRRSDVSKINTSLVPWHTKVDIITKLSIFCAVHQICFWLMQRESRPQEYVSHITKLTITHSIKVFFQILLKSDFVSLCRSHPPRPVQCGWECCSTHKPQIWGWAPGCEAVGTLAFCSSPQPPRYLHLQHGKGAPPLSVWRGSGSLWRNKVAWEQVEIQYIYMFFKLKVKVERKMKENWKTSF